MPWPEADPELLASDTVTLVVQVNGKLRDRIEAPAAAPEAELLELARESEKVRRHLDGKEIVKEVVVPGKLVNLVVRCAARLRPAFLVQSGRMLVRRLSEAPAEEWHKLRYHPL